MISVAGTGFKELSLRAASLAIAVSALAIAAPTAAAPDLPAATPGFPAIAPLPAVTDDGTVTVPSFALPFSSFASPEAKALFIRRLRNPMPVSLDIAKMRQVADETMFAPQLAIGKKLYPYTSEKSKIGGVPVETFVPAAGVAPENRDRVLINLHGGGFIAGGGGLGGAVESVPVASAARIKVIAVDYRMAPEALFPAASEDVASVYRVLLKTYRPENIGIYGCSAGGVLTGESISWFLKEHLPLPGAIGIFCASINQYGQGDSGQIFPRLGSALRIVNPAKADPAAFPVTMPYFRNASPQDPLAVPGVSKDILKAFPPTLFLTGTRAPEMSSVVESHLDLRELGVRSELLVFDGMDHGFHIDAGTPEGARATRLIARFFMESLGRKHPG